LLLSRLQTDRRFDPPDHVASTISDRHRGQIGKRVIRHQPEPPQNFNGDDGPAPSVVAVFDL
jgi:hypothetical protein